MPPSTAAVPRREPTRPAGRYGEQPPRQRRRAPVVAIVVGALAAVGLGWVSWGMLQPSAEGEVTLYTAIDDSQVELQLSVTRPVGSTAVCSVEALSSGMAQVGLIEVVVEPADQQVSRVRLTMATSEPAAFASVRTCELR